MPLSEAADRELLHRRDISVRGYHRADGCFDIEGHLTDTKTYGFDSEERGTIAPGEPLHEMWMRMTMSEDLTILACEAVTDYAPYAVCPMATPNFAGLAGLTIRSGFLRAAAERVGGTKGCTHLREMLQQMATVAFQTITAARSRRAAAQPRSALNPAAAGRNNPTLVNSCHAYASDGPIVQRRWPDLYTGPSQPSPEPAAS